MARQEITEDRPLSYTAHDGAVIVLSVAGPERLFTLTVSGLRVITSPKEDDIRALARHTAEVRNERWNAAMKAGDPAVTIDHIAQAASLPAGTCPCLANPLGHAEAECPRGAR